MGLLLLPGTWMVGGIGITLAHVATVGLLLYYLRLDTGFGVASVVLFTFLLVTAIQVHDLLGAQAWKLFLAAFVLSWVAQLVGHEFFEGRKPALADNVWQVFTAPIFVVAEIAFGLGMRAELRQQVEAKMRGSAN